MITASQGKRIRHVMRGLYFFCEMVYTTSEKNGKVRLPKKIKITDNSDADESVFQGNLSSISRHIKLIIVGKLHSVFDN